MKNTSSSIQFWGLGYLCFIQLNNKYQIIPLFIELKTKMPINTDDYVRRELRNRYFYGESPYKIPYAYPAIQMLFLSRFRY